MNIPPEINPDGAIAALFGAASFLVLLVGGILVGELIARRKKT